MYQTAKYFSSKVINACRSVLLMDITFDQACHIYGMSSKSDKDDLSAAIKAFKAAAQEMAIRQKPNKRHKV